MTCACRGGLRRWFLFWSVRVHCVVVSWSASGWYLIPPMPLYSDIYKTANNEGDIILRASPTIMLVSFGILAAVGIVSGLLPAMRAARMDPVVALRHE